MDARLRAGGNNEGLVRADRGAGDAATVPHLGGLSAVGNDLPDENEPVLGSVLKETIGRFVSK